MRIDYGTGYRMYFTRRGKTVVILLCGGDKRSQSKDIKAAQRMARTISRIRPSISAYADLRTALSTSVLPSDQIAPGTL
jgi:hypothetical protein